MNLNTQCPQCGTTFPVSMEQLQLRKGYIRCINCATIFDGFDAVVGGTAPEPVAAHAVSVPAPEPSPLAPVVARQAAPVATPSAAAKQASPVVAPSSIGSSAIPTTTPPVVVRHRQAAQPAPYVPTSVAAGTAGIAPSEPDFRVGDIATPGTEPVFKVGDSVADPDIPAISVVHRRTGHLPAEPLYVEPRPGARAQAPGRAPRLDADERPSVLDRAAGIAWRVAILAAALVLVAQLVYVYRVQIASQVPALRPMLERACAQLNCTVAYSRRIDLITIAGAGLSTQKQAPDDQGGAMLLQLTLRNSHNKPQEWPTLELDLNDFSGTLQVRKNIGPDIYLTAAERQQPFAANSEKVLRLPIALNGLKINGFQVRKFYP